jgi:RNA ligase (TIGR02306 family)
MAEQSLSQMVENIANAVHTQGSSIPQNTSINDAVCELVEAVSHVQVSPSDLKNSVQEVANAVSSERKLAQIVRIAQIVPIIVPNSDPIEYATNVELAILEDPVWQCVVSKEDKLAKGNLAIYFAIDSVLDKDNPAFKFMDGKRLKTKKFLGQLSQGLPVPLDRVQFYEGDPAKLKVGDDLTTLMKVEKYLFKGDEAGESKLPPGVRKTHENRVQECQGLLKELAAEATLVTVTRKEDGMSASVVLVQGEFYVCGHRTTRKSDDKDSSHYFEVAKRFDVEKKMREVGRNLAVQGEIVGVKINGNTLKFAKGTPNDFRVFYIWDIDNQRKLRYDETDALCKMWGLNRPPLLYRGPFKKEWASVKNLLAFAETIEYSAGVPAEGVVVSTDNGLGSPHHSFKVISDLWLLKTGR